MGGLVSSGGLITEPAQLRTYECDGLTGYRVVPALVVLPATTEEVAAVVKVCAREHIPFVARGAGTGLSGGALPVADGIVIGLSRMRQVLSVDVDNQRAVVQP
ncbi:MAG TPA: FAD-binding protein, partial [Actinomycetes bacterium]|nr:FAD-binding protein [Actinomycetes bacterium]